MPRPLRIYVEGAAYYVTSRAGSKALLFQDPQDYDAYLAFLTEYQREFHFRLYAFVLLPDQLHLVLEPTADVNISEIMHSLNSRYTKHYTKRYGMSGHLFQGRYKSTVIEKGPLLLRVTSYLHTLPVCLSLASNLKEYPWSSAPSYLERVPGLSLAPSFTPLEVQSQDVLEILAREVPGTGYERYLQVVTEQEWEAVRLALQQPAVGSESFLLSVQRRAATCAESAALVPVLPQPALPNQRAGSRKGGPLFLAVAMVFPALAVASLFLTGLPKNEAAPVQSAISAVQEVKPQLTQVPMGQPQLAQATVAASPLMLNGTEWEVQILPMYAKGTSPVQQDLLIFEANQISSKLLASQGFSKSNLTLTLQPDGTLLWETMQTHPSGETVFWRGEWDGQKMRGIFSRHPKDGTPQDFLFRGVNHQPTETERTL